MKLDSLVGDEKFGRWLCPPWSNHSPGSSCAPPGFWLLRYFEFLSLEEKKIPPPVGRCCYSLTSNQSLENRIILASNLHRLIITCCHHMIISLLTFKWHKHCKGGVLKKIFSNSILYRNAVVVKLVGDFTTQQGTLNFSPMQHKLIAHQLQIVKVIQPRERLYYQLQYYQVQYNAMQLYQVQCQQAQHCQWVLCCCCRCLSSYWRSPKTVGLTSLKTYDFDQRQEMVISPCPPIFWRGCDGCNRSWEFESLFR